MDPQDSLFDMNNAGRIGLSHHDDVINRAHNFLSMAQQHGDVIGADFGVESSNHI
jgi:hypothetical protein